MAGVRPDTIRPHYADAQQVLDHLAAIGVDYDDVVRVLEEQGVEKFGASWADVTDRVTERLEAASWSSSSSSSSPKES